MHYQKNIQFSRLIKVNGQLKEFNFRKAAPDSGAYHVDIGDERGNRHMWQMEKALGMWKIKESALPAWIVDLEQDLDMVIQEEESQLGRLVK